MLKYRYTKSTHTHIVRFVKTSETSLFDRSKCRVGCFLFSYGIINLREVRKMENTVTVDISKDDAIRLSSILDNILFNNGYDLYDPYLNSLFQLKEKLDLEVELSKSHNGLIN